MNKTLSLLHQSEGASAHGAFPLRTDLKETSFPSDVVPDAKPVLTFAGFAPKFDGLWIFWIIFGLRVVFVILDAQSDKR